jgi:hypothetical protein
MIARSAMGKPSSLQVATGARTDKQPRFFGNSGGRPLSFFRSAALGFFKLFAQPPGPAFGAPEHDGLAARGNTCVARRAKAIFWRPKASERAAVGVSLGNHSSTNTCRWLSIDHDLNRLRKLCPSSRLPLTSATLPVTFSIFLSPIVKVRMRKVCDGTVEPSASL